MNLRDHLSRFYLLSRNAGWKAVEAYLFKMAEIL